MARKKKDTEDMSETENQAEDQNTSEALPPAGEGSQYIKVQGQMFLAPAPYVEGHVLSQEEAVALNRILGDNLRNNFAAQMKAAAAQGRDNLGQAEFDQYASTYHFGMRRVRVAHSIDPIGKIERTLAEQAVRDAVAKKGHSWKSLDKDQREAFVIKAIETGRFRAEAERIYSTRNAAAEALGDLFADAA